MKGSETQIGSAIWIFAGSFIISDDKIHLEGYMLEQIMEISFEDKDVLWHTKWNLHDNINKLWEIFSLYWFF